MMAAPKGTASTDPIERAVGMLRYATTTPGIGGRLKAYPEDFVVEEVPLAFPPPTAGGKYTVAALRVRNWETNRLVGELARLLGIGRDTIFFAGTKDKRAVTTQYVSLRASEEAVRGIQLRDVEVLDTRRVDRAPKIGELVGNRFVIRIRDHEGTQTEALQRARDIVATLTEAGGFPNYFGVQRFGTMRPVTHLVGQAILRGDLEEAVRLYAGNPMESDPPEAHEARKFYEETRDAAAALERYPRYLQFERAMLDHLARRPGDHEGALFTLPPNLRTMFVYAEQSRLFNHMVSRRLEAGIGLNEPQLGDLVVGIDAEGRPEKETRHAVTKLNHARVQKLCREGRALVTGAIIGTEADYAQGPMGDIERAVVQEAGYTPQTFGIPHLPEVASYGTRRELQAPLGPVRLDAHRDDHGDHLELSFFLLKGSYATSLLREVLKTNAAAFS